MVQTLPCGALDIPVWALPVLSWWRYLEKMLISLKSLSASDVWHQSFLLLEEELLMPRCCAVGSVLAELPVLCKNLSLPKKRPLFSAQVLHTARDMWAGRGCEG